MQMDFPFREDYPPRNDIVFSIMFGDMELFSLLLKTVTGHTLNAKEIISQASVTPDNVEHNYIRFDTFAKDENGTIYSIDLQNTYSETLIKNRTIYYACRAISSQTVEKGCYEKLNKVVVSFIMTSKKNKLPVEVITMQNQEHENYSDLLTLHNIYTKSVNQSENIGINSDLKIFSEFFSINTTEEMEKFMKNYSDTETGKRLIHLYSKAIIKDDLNNIKEREYFGMKITEQDINEAKNQALAEGIERGLEKGRAEGIKRGLEKGRAEGRAEGFLKALIELVKDGLLPERDAAAKANMSLNEFQKIAGLAT